MRMEDFLIKHGIGKRNNNGNFIKVTADVSIDTKGTLKNVLLKRTGDSLIIDWESALDMPNYDHNLDVNYFRNLTKYDAYNKDIDEINDTIYTLVNIDGMEITISFN